MRPHGENLGEIAAQDAARTGNDCNFALKICIQHIIFHCFIPFLIECSYCFPAFSQASNRPLM